MSITIVIILGILNYCIIILTQSLKYGSFYNTYTCSGICVKEKQHVKLQFCVLAMLTLYRT